MTENELELWKDIDGYEGRYQASNRGRIRSLNRIITTSRGRKMTIKETILKPEKVFDGYERVCLSKNGKDKHYRVATLVYEAFLGPIPEGLEIDHINGIRTDNRLENLRAVSHRANCWNPITRERHLAANKRRSETMKEYRSEEHTSELQSRE